MSFTEMTGGKPDPDCLHCALPAFIAQFEKEHPSKTARQLIGEVAQILGELVGSEVVNTGCDSNELLMQTAAHMARTAAQLVATMSTMRRRPS